MISYNKFCFIGVVYSDSKTTITKNNTKVCKFTLTIKDDYSKTKTNYVPLVAYKSIADKCELLCKNGNIVAVEGEISTKEDFNNTTGQTEIRMFFIVSDIMTIQRLNRTKITDKKFNDLIKTYTLD